MTRRHPSRRGLNLLKLCGCGRDIGGLWAANACKHRPYRCVKCCPECRREAEARKEVKAS